MSQTLPATEEAVEQSIRRFANQKFRRLGLMNGAAELDVIADRAAELEQKLALLNEALDEAAVEYASATHELESWRRIRAEFLYEAQMMLDVQARKEAEETNKEAPQ